MGGLKVVFIAGLGRSGSTLLSTLLGQVPGLWNVGELRYLVERGVLGHDRCGCGDPVPDCAFWKPVLAAAGVPSDPEACRELIAQEARVARLRQARKLIGDRAAGHPWLRSQAGAWLDHLAAVHRALAEATGEIVVDSSKLPSYGAALEATGEIDLRVIHLVRDPRGVAHSWSSARARADRGRDAEMDRRDPYSAALLWSAWNEVAYRLWGKRDGYVQVSYEDMAKDPAGTLRRAVEAIGLPERPDLDFLDGCTASVGVSHTVAGNPNRMHTGTLQIAADARWKEELPARARLGVRLLTAPIARRYAP